jgi:hypothetical protein
VCTPERTPCRCTAEALSALWRKIVIGETGSAAVVALGLRIADPLIGLAITLVILRITWQSWQAVRGTHRH